MNHFETFNLPERNSVLNTFLNRMENKCHGRFISTAKTCLSPLSTILIFSTKRKIFYRFKLHKEWVFLFKYQGVCVVLNLTWPVVSTVFDEPMELGIEIDQYRVDQKEFVAGNDILNALTKPLF